MDKFESCNAAARLHSFAQALVQNTVAARIAAGRVSFLKKAISARVDGDLRIDVGGSKIHCRAPGQRHLFSRVRLKAALRRRGLSEAGIEEILAESADPSYVRGYILVKLGNAHRRAVEAEATVREDQLGGIFVVGERISERGGIGCQQFKLLEGGGGDGHRLAG